MRVDIVGLLGAFLTCGFIALAASADASVTEHCGSVSYTYPCTHGHGHGALNNLTAVNVSCARARSVSKTFLIIHKAPEHWHARTRMVVIDGSTVGEEIFTRGRARVGGDLAN